MSACGRFRELRPRDYCFRGQRGCSAALTGGRHCANSAGSSIGWPSRSVHRRTLKGGIHLLRSQAPLRAGSWNWAVECGSGSRGERESGASVIEHEDGSSKACRSGTAEPCGRRGGGWPDEDRAVRVGQPDGWGRSGDEEGRLWCTERRRPAAPREPGVWRRKRLGRCHRWRCDSARRGAKPYPTTLKSRARPTLVR